MATTDRAAGSPSLQFGTPSAGRIYRDRPAAFGVAANAAGDIALVHVRRPGEDFFDLPGGAIELGETEVDALIREFGEETGLVITVGALLTRSRQFLTTAAGAPANNRAGHFRVDLVGEDRKLKIEHDHTLEWHAPVEALKHLRHDSHAWALAAWMRSRAG